MATKKRTSKKQDSTKKKSEKKVVHAVPEQGGFLSWFQEPETLNKKTSK